jgi:hypothetical protein
MPSNRRMVVSGKINSGSTRLTIEVRLGDSFDGLPEWNPRDEFPETDHDLIRKQRIEDEVDEL